MADAYDAMTTDRPYRRACSPKEALERLWEGRVPSSIRKWWRPSIESGKPRRNPWNRRGNCGWLDKMKPVRRTYVFIPFLVGAVLAASLLTGDSLKGLLPGQNPGSILFFLPPPVPDCPVSLGRRPCRTRSCRDLCAALGGSPRQSPSARHEGHDAGAPQPNFLVIACNGGYMPMSLNALRGAGPREWPSTCKAAALSINGIAMSEGTLPLVLGRHFLPASSLSFS